MKIRIYVGINEYANNGYDFTVVPADQDYAKGYSGYRFVAETEFNLNEHLPWLCQQAQEAGTAMAKKATEAFNLAVARRLEFESKFLQLQHTTIDQET